MARPGHFQRQGCTGGAAGSGLGDRVNVGVMDLGSEDGGEAGFGGSVFDTGHKA